MCGIFAAYSPSGNLPSDTALRAAVSSVSHRGPDAIGFYQNKSCFLGHTRLAIVGVEPQSNQPFHFDSLTVVYNGEVFNFLELREELRKVGYSFDTNSDTEVVIKAFHYWGEACFSKFNGMWGIVIYDHSNKSLTVSRDRFGQKPLFVTRKEGVIFFASEFHQLVEFSGREIDFGIIQRFLREGTFESLGRTFMAGIEEFPKAHTVVFRNSLQPIGTRYWSYWNGEVKPVTQESLEEFQSILEDAVRIRLRADVPYSLMLSGGVDSTIVAAIARKFVGSEKSIKAFTYSSADQNDESEYAKHIADELNLDLTIRTQSNFPEDYLSRLRAIVYNMGRGHSSLAIVSLDCLQESVNQAGIKIAIDGQGADELLAGYPTYHPVLLWHYFMTGQFTQLPGLARDAIKNSSFNSLLVFVRNMLPESFKKFGRRLYGYERFFSEIQDRPGSLIIPRSEGKAKNRDRLNRYLNWQHDLGLSNLLFYGDIVSMRNSVENRSPFMDHRLVDFSFRHSAALKVDNGNNKCVLRTLPYYKQFRPVLERKKIGFASAIKPQTKRKMIFELRNSQILEWPILSPALKECLRGELFMSNKYERILFRLIQVHFWEQLFFGKAEVAWDNREPAQALRYGFS